MVVSATSRAYHIAIVIWKPAFNICTTLTLAPECPSVGKTFKNIEIYLIFIIHSTILLFNSSARQARAVALYFDILRPAVLAELSALRNCSGTIHTPVSISYVKIITTATPAGVIGSLWHHDCTTG